MISWILKKVAIGEYLDALNEEALAKERINCILSLRGGKEEDSSVEEETHCANLGIAFFRVPIFDRDYWTNHESGKGQAKVKIQCKAAAYILDLLVKRYKRILVHCTGGVDRAPFVVALYMANIELENQDDYPIKRTLKYFIIEAYKFIKGKRTQIHEHMEWV